MIRPALMIRYADLRKLAVSPGFPADSNDYSNFTHVDRPAGGAVWRTWFPIYELAGLATAWKQAFQNF
jgi:hypothetical protein